MDSLTVDNTYGQALYEAAYEKGTVEEIAEEFNAVGKVFEDNPLLYRLFLIPIVSAMHKKEVAKNVFEGRISQEMLNFIYVLIDKRRVGAFENIRSYYEKFVWEADGLIKGIIYSAVPLEKEKVKAFEEKTGAALGTRVKLDSRVDKSLIGGAKIYIDGKLIDASVKTRLETMKQRMKT